MAHARIAIILTSEADEAGVDPEALHNVLHAPCSTSATMPKACCRGGPPVIRRNRRGTCWKT
jgi:hypothetical protein